MSLLNEDISNTTNFLEEYNFKGPYGGLWWLGIKLEYTTEGVAEISPSIRPSIIVPSRDYGLRIKYVEKFNIFNRKIKRELIIDHVSYFLGLQSESKSKYIVEDELDIESYLDQHAKRFLEDYWFKPVDLLKVKFI